MRRTSFAGSECPIARGADAIGDVWTLLILRDAVDGFTRFDELQTDLGIAPTMLTRRLAALVDAGLLERRRYQDHPPRDEYVLTPRGRTFLPVIYALYGAEPTGTLRMIDRATGSDLDPVLVDRGTGRPLSELDVAFAPGPAATPAFRDRFTRVR